MKLLIAENNVAMRRTIKSIVRDIATEIYECANGDEAISFYSLYKPDWVIMDIKMDILDGIEATARIVAQFPTAKIIIVTNYDDYKLREAALKAGAVYFLLKKDLLEINDMLI